MHRAALVIQFVGAFSVMLRRSSFWALGMMFNRSQKDEIDQKKGWSDLFFKPATRDEKIKDYVPEVLEESLAEQRAVLAQQTTRDEIVDHGHRILRELENKAPTPSIYPSLNKLLQLYGSDHLISQRALNLLLYPGASTAFQSQQPPELIAAFADNFRTFVDSIEQGGSYVHEVKMVEEAKIARLAATAASDVEKIEAGDAAEGTAAADGAETPAEEAEAPTAKAEAVPAQEPQAHVAEPPDVTYFVKVVAAMGMANLQINDHQSALQCCDAALQHVMDDSRKGGLLGLKAGVLVKMKRYDDAVAAANLAIEASQNAQGYLQGATALRLAGKKDEAVAMLEAGVEALPGHDAIVAQIEAIEAAERKVAERKAAALEAKKEQDAAALPA